MSVERWLGGLSPSTTKSAKSNFNRFLDWLKINGGKFSTSSPDELVAYQKAQTGESRYEILDLLQTYILSKEGTYQYKRTQMVAVNSFFQHNRADLPRDVRFRINRNIKEGVNGSLTPDEIRKVILSCNPTYSTVFMCMFQSGMGEEEFLYWNTHGLSKLKEDLESDPSIIRINLAGRKSNRNVKPYYTLLSGDALQKLKYYMANVRPAQLEKPHNTRATENTTRHNPKSPIQRKDPIQGNSAIFIDQYGFGITKLAIYQNWTRHTKLVGIRDGRGFSGKNLHEIRDTFRTLWRKSPSDQTCAEFLMGHTVDKLQYDKACQDVDWVKMEYRKAQPWLNILSSERGYGLVKEDAMVQQQETIDMLVKGFKNLQDLYIKKVKEIDNLKNNIV